MANMTPNRSSRLKFSKKLKEVYGEDEKEKVPDGIASVNVASFELDFNIEEKSPETTPQPKVAPPQPKGPIDPTPATVTPRITPKATPRMTPRVAPKVTPRTTVKSTPKPSPRITPRPKSASAITPRKVPAADNKSDTSEKSPEVEPDESSCAPLEEMDVQSQLSVESPHMKLKTVNEYLAEIGDLKIELAGLKSNQTECKKTLWEVGLLIADCVEISARCDVNDDTLDSLSLFKVAMEVRSLANQLPPWKVRLMTTITKQLKDFEGKREEHMGKEKHMHQIASGLMEEKERMHSDLVELRTTSNLRIRELERNLESVAKRNGTLEEENMVLKAKCDKLYEEHLSIPRLEEKMHRETKEQLFSMNVMMRKKEKHWSKAEQAAKESGYWQQKVKKLELQLFETTNALNAEKRASGVTKRDFEREIETLKRECSRFMGGMSMLPRRSSADLGGGRRAACFAIPQPAQTEQQSSPAPAAGPINRGDSPGSFEGGHNAGFLMKMTEDMLSKLRSDVAKKDVIIKRLSVQLARARGRPLSEVEKEGFDSMGRDLDDLKKREMFGRQVAENEKIMNAQATHKGNSFHTVAELLDSYYEERNVDDEVIENDSHNSEEEREFEALKNEKKKVFEGEARDHLRGRRGKIEEELERSAKAQTQTQHKRPLSAPIVVREVRESGNFEPKHVKKLTVQGGLQERSQRSGSTPAQRQKEQEEKQKELEERQRRREERQQR